MTLLALDPSSTRTGYAVFIAGCAAPSDAGYLRATAHLPAWDRVEQMCDEVGLLLSEWKPANVVIEVPSGKVGGGQRRGAGGSLCIYGFAVGAIWATCRAAKCRPLVDEVDERTWTRCVPKKMRQARIAAEFPEYRAAVGKDGGGDVADAIGIGLWWMAQRRAKGLTG